MTQFLSKNVKSGRIIASSVAVAFAILSCSGLEGFSARPLAVQTQTAQESPAEIARLHLARIHTDCIQQISDDGVRRAVQGAVAALQEVADNTSQEREAELVEQVRRNVGALRASVRRVGRASIDCDGSYAECKGTFRGHPLAIVGCYASYVTCVILSFTDCG